MYKKTPVFTASVASAVYFVIFIILKYFLQKVVDPMGAFIGAIAFGAVIFVVHLLLKRRYSDRDQYV